MALNNNRNRMKDLKKLEEKYRQLGEEIENLKSEQELIPVPENIRIEGLSCKPLCINNNEQSLYYDYETWKVNRASKSDERQFYLKNVDRSEIKAGDVFCRTIREYPDLTSLYGYAISLEDSADSYCFWNGKGVSVGAVKWNHYYKVVTKEG